MLCPVHKYLWLTYWQISWTGYYFLVDIAEKGIVFGECLSWTALFALLCFVFDLVTRIVIFVSPRHVYPHSLSRVVVPATLHSIVSVAGTTTLDREWFLLIVHLWLPPLHVFSDVYSMTYSPLVGCPSTEWMRNIMIGFFVLKNNRLNYTPIIKNTPPTVAR